MLLVLLQQEPGLFRKQMLNLKSERLHRWHQRGRKLVLIPKQDQNSQKEEEALIAEWRRLQQVVALRLSPFQMKRGAALRQ